jgi:hypothetical protein
VQSSVIQVTPTGRVKRPSISNVCEQVKNSWQRVKSETVVNSLKKVTLDGSEDDIYVKNVQVLWDVAPCRGFTNHLVTILCGDA